MRIDDLVGRRFGLLTVRLLVDQDKHGNARWLCDCQCGGEKIVAAPSLKTGNCKSCGCLRGKQSITHGMSGTRIYHVWKTMNERCSNPNSEKYPRYGGRGIRVCPQWAGSFETFLADMGVPPLGTTLDRINNDGNYEPENCRWATPHMQNRNRSDNRVLVLNGESHILADWSRKLGIKEFTILARLKYGWSVEAALTTPVRHLRASRR